MPPSPPNLLMLFPDQWRWDWLGHHDGSDSPYGRIPVQTPHLDALARRGTRFTQCRTNSPLCAPARACLATGRRYEHCGVAGNDVDLEPASDTVFQRLRGAGYRVACTGKTDLQKPSRWRGRDGWTRAIGQLGFTDSANQSGKWDAVLSGSETPHDLYMTRLHGAGLVETHGQDYQRRAEARPRVLAHPTPLPREHYTDDVCGRKALDFLEAWPVASGGHEPGPWMMWVNFPGPHEPFDAPAELLDHFAQTDFPLPVNHDAPEVDGQPAVAQDHAAVRRNYAAMMGGIDQWIGRLLDAVERRGETDRTLVLFCSDHGEMLGDHGRWSKGVAYEGSVHVPLLAAGPGVEAGAERDDLVELIDLSATLLHAAGLPVSSRWEARSLLDTSRPPREVQVSALHDWRMVFDGRYKWVGFDDGRTLLFDLDQDPGELRNVATDQPERAAELCRRYEQEAGEK